MQNVKLRGFASLTGDGFGRPGETQEASGAALLCFQFLQEKWGNSERSESSECSRRWRQAGETGDLVSRWALCSQQVGQGRSHDAGRNVAGPAETFLLLYWQSRDHLHADLRTASASAFQEVLFLLKCCNFCYRFFFAHEVIDVTCGGSTWPLLWALKTFTVVIS